MHFRRMALRLVVLSHSFSPNACFVLMPRAILITALRPIAEGEEIVFDYGWTDSGFRSAGIDVPAP